MYLNAGMAEAGGQGGRKYTYRDYYLPPQIFRPCAIPVKSTTYHTT